MSANPQSIANQPDPDQGHARQWPSTPYSDEVRLPVPQERTACVIALLGDCTTACNYFPPANRPESHLAVRLRRTFKQPVVIRNFGCDGGTAADLLNSRRLDQIVSGLERLDIVFVRYGINDRKACGIDACIHHLQLLAARIRDRHPHATIIFESGIWVDHPAHYLWDRNSRLQPLYAAMEAFAAAGGYRFLNVFKRMAEETKRGNWDLRIRGMPGADGQFNIVDDSFDEFYGNDPAFFTNIHPNSSCLRLIALWQTELLHEMFGNTLPGPW
jgi:hypothetical protein